MVNLCKLIQRGFRSILRRKRKSRILIQEEEYIDEAEKSDQAASDRDSNNGNDMTLAIAAARVAKDILIQNALRPRSIGGFNSQIRTSRSWTRFHKPVVCSVPPRGKNFKVRFWNEILSIIFSLLYSHRKLLAFGRLELVTNNIYSYYCNNL